MTLVLGVAPAQATDLAAGVDGMDAAVTSTGDIVVGGKAIFAGPTEVVATDDAADNVIPGTDLQSAAITPVNNSQLRFDLEIGDLPEPTAGTPEVVNYWWEFQVVKGSSTSQYALQAWRSSTAADLTCGVIFACPPGEPGEPRFQLSTCEVDPNTGQRTCSAEPVLGEQNGDVFSWTVLLNAISATGGGVEILPVLNSAGNPVPIAASHGVSGISWNSGGTSTPSVAGNSAMLGDVMTFEGWSFPERTVELGIASAETPDDAVDASTPVTSLVNSGTFSGSLPGPDTSGDYKVVARACLGPDNCGTASRIVTVQ